MMEKISSRSNQQIIEYAKLKNKKYREESGLFFFEGIKLLQEAILHFVPIVAVFCTEKCLDDLVSIPKSIPVFQVTDSVYEKLTDEKAPQGVFCVAKHLDNLHKSDTIDERLFITGRLFLLEGIRDPGNLGTILRTSNAMGTDIVVLSDDCADLYNSKTIRASMGAVFRQKTYRTTKLPSFIKELREKGILIYAAALDHDSVDVRTLDTNSNASLCFAVGNEGHGLSHEVISACNGKVMIPMSPECESLNAAIACSILLWEQAKHSL